LEVYYTYGYARSANIGVAEYR